MERPQFWPQRYRRRFMQQAAAATRRATAAAAELSRAELQEGGELLRQKVLLYKPQALAVLGITAYRTAFGLPKSVLGLQPERIGETELWVLPNPSGLNAHYPPAALARTFEAFRLALR